MVSVISMENMLRLVLPEMKNSWCLASISSMGNHAPQVAMRVKQLKNGVCKFCGNMLCLLSRMLNNSWSLVTVQLFKIHASML